VSLLTARNKSDEELRGLVYSLTPRIVEDEPVWYKRPAVLGIIVLVAAITLNIIFW
jgi:SSS family solute:Na+ symporter